MPVSFNNGLGAWQVNNQGFYSTQEAAEAAEAARSGANALPSGPSSEEFSANFYTPESLAPKAPVDPNSIPNPANVRLRTNTCHDAS